MDVMNLIKQLKEERNRVSEVILMLERLASGTGEKRRGRPPKWLAAVRNVQMTSGTFPVPRRFSAATWKKMAKSQRRRWSKVRANG